VFTVSGNKSNWHASQSVRNGAVRATVPLAAARANQVWCLDFCHDACRNGTKLKVLAVKDEYTRECLALEAATRLNSQSVRRVLQRLQAERGAPEYLRSDNGPEFIARHWSI
jgi:putative transposase